MEPFSAKVEASNLITPLINVFKSINAEWKNLFNIGLEEYLQSQTEKYYYTNTFIHRSEKVVFKDIYYPVKAKYKKLTTDFADTNTIFENYSKITIVGTAGSGKTTLLKYIFLNVIQTGNFIPVLIELRNINEYNGDLEKLLVEKILKTKIKPTDNILKRALESGKFLFLLDGYDELYSHKKQEINRQIELFIDTYSKNKFLITTRPGSGIEGFMRFYDFQICELDDSDVKQFITKIVEEPERRKRIIKIVKDPKNSSYMDYLKNPLLLSMFIIAFESHPEIPKRKSAFYRNVFDTLYSIHDGITKNSYPREKRSKLQKEEFEKILCLFSFASFTEGDYTFTYEYLSQKLLKIKKTSQIDFNVEDVIYDFRTTISIMVLDGFEYSFPHRSMQEYFTALFISNLPSVSKRKAYTRLTNTFFHQSTDNNFHFWNLCNEIDNIGFYQYIILPKLKLYEKAYNTNNHNQLFDEYIKLSRPFVNYSFIETPESDFFIAYFQTFYSLILDYLNVYNPDILFSLNHSKEIAQDIKNIIKKPDEYGFYSIEKDSELKKYLLFKININDIKKTKKQIIEKRKEIEKIIRINKKSIDDILNIK